MENKEKSLYEIALDHSRERELSKSKELNMSFGEQLEKLQMEISNLPEDKQDAAQAILNRYAEGMFRQQSVSEEIDNYIENHPLFDPLLISKRPEGMSFEAYKVLRRASNRTVREYVRYSKGKITRLRKG